ncbi:MAG TPA: LysM peptidoglycan-binding domain-containing protein [Polyangia bacterium]|jgi:membrane-bound lytic murein transglycosylase D
MDRTIRWTLVVIAAGALLRVGPAAAAKPDQPDQRHNPEAKPTPAASQPVPTSRPEDFRPDPRRVLATEEDQRRSLRGDAEPPIVPNESDELRELRRFEEEAFPREPRPTLPPVAPLKEGAVPPPRSRPTGADAQHPDLRTPPTAAPAPQLRPAGPPDWFKRLKMPNLPVRWDPKVQTYLDWFKSSRTGRSIMSRWLQRQSRYRPMIEAAAKRMGLPTDIIYVAMIESGYNPTVVSGVGATGMWQFMGRTGKVYGLEQEFWYDERRDPERATEAAMHFWKDLYTRFGSWHLALAGYHAGYAAILKSIVAFNTNDYWELCRHENGLPHETTLYVPKALAAAIIGANRAAFGFGDIVPDPVIEFDRVRIPTSTSLATIARAAGVKESDLVALNPDLKRHRTPPRPWNLRVPRGTADRVARNFDAARREYEKIDTYVVRFGERLDDIAARYKIAMKDLRKLNGIEDSAEVRAGVVMLVPRRTPAELQAEADRETEETIVAVPDKDAKVEGRERVFYRVRDGDGLPEVARFFKVSLEDLARWNAIDLTVKIQPGMILQLFIARELDRSKVLLVAGPKVRTVTIGSQEYYDTRAIARGRNRLVYICRKGDNLERIGRRFDLTVGQMARINQMPRGTDLKPGQKIIVYAPQKHAAAPKAQARKAPPKGREPARHVTRAAPKKRR